MSKPKLIQKSGGWVCTGIHPCTNGQITWWAKTPEDAYKGYQKLYEGVDERVRKVKLHGSIAQVPLHKMTQRDIANIEAIDYTRPAYSSYDIYDQAEEQNKNNENILSVYIGVLGVMVIAMFVGIALS